MSSTLTLKRETAGVLELRRSGFEVVLDGKTVGSIDRHQTLELQVDSGSHTLQVKSGRYSSHLAEFAAAEDSNVTFLCNGAILWPRYVASLLVPDLGLRLKGE